MSSLLLESLEIKEIITKDIIPHTSIFTFYHLPNTSMGITIGNNLRQILMTLIEGIAILGIKITDKIGPKNNIISPIEQIGDSTPYLILNLKKIILKEKKTDKKGIFCLEMKIENKEQELKTIRAGDFEENENVEIKNPELCLTTLETGGVLEIKLYCQKSWGYHSEEEQEKDHHFEEDNVIFLDSDYSPVKKVSFGCSSDTNPITKTIITSSKKKEGELTITVTTNGAISPREAVLEALTISEDISKSIRSRFSKNNFKDEEKEALRQQN
ncbi:hypothetical protein [endosymbiont GvMRE of Glomus versiforme]|uniref:hypothetical protein n=1 Tax=endosymbiont GvMRE of Glomus versiforme TaxID=2039283 RepID=UPI000EEEA408|nr:hypothetical protein [endosymbiont GvMRE of Glomus versiforme]RHZ35512.1 DNA-directed RNA polymerase subunit alpha [endosymbiont GvMRE of Glomus versiforme]